MDIISVRRWRKRNSLDVLILSPLARINRSSENDRRRGKQIPDISDFFFSEWKLVESFTEMSTVVLFIMSLQYSDWKISDIWILNIFCIYLLDVLWTCKTWWKLWSLITIFLSGMNDSGMSFLRRFFFRINVIRPPRKNFNLLSNRNFIVYIFFDDASRLIVSLIASALTYKNNRDWRKGLRTFCKRMQISCRY